MRGVMRQTLTAAEAGFTVAGGLAADAGLSPTKSAAEPAKPARAPLREIPVSFVMPAPLDGHLIHVRLCARRDEPP